MTAAFPTVSEWLLSAVFWTAIFTAALTVSTVLLWWQTKRLAEGAQTQAAELKKLERPYVYMMPLVDSLQSYFRDETPTASVAVRVKNIGRGPARINFCICSAGFVRREDEAPGTQFRLEVNEHALGPGDSIEHRFDITNGIRQTAATIENLERNFQLLHVTLWVSYRDVAGQDHDTSETWRFMLNAGLRRVTSTADRHT